MDSKKVTSEYRLSHWTGIIRERQASGMNIRDFCESAGITETAYYYWQRKLRIAASQHIISTQNELQISDAFKFPAPQGWAVCEAAGPAVSEKVLPIEIGSFRILAGPDLDPNLLASVCRVLVAL
jgi:hypothetical protein